MAEEKKTGLGPENDGDPQNPLKDRVRIIIFEAHTAAGKAFDVGLIICILLSVLAVLLDSVAALHKAYGDYFFAIEWFFTIIFTLEYAARLWCIQDTARYARSFYGLVDLLGIIPTYLSLLVADTQYLLVIRILRVLRVFRVLRMVRYVGEAELLTQALIASRRKITVFISTVLALVVIFGSFMYLIEGEANGFTSIPRSIYWAVITLTTVGYGDLTPITPLGQAVATLVMIMGYGIIAVPTGIVTLELSEAHKRAANTRTCPACAVEGHVREATYCWRCGAHLYDRDEKRRGPAATETREIGEGL
ncbi:MAG: ion transporter [Gammaproteobacteria bacterium]|jgi:voltage-gated potassium channel|nr:MAG: ion transporter [Gammaproteobacteria bacterium]